MQDCFRQHPDTYGDELADPGPPDDEGSEIVGGIDASPATLSTAPIPSPASSSKSSTTSSTDLLAAEPQTQPPATLSSPTPSDADIHPVHTTNDDNVSKTARAKDATEQVSDEHSDTGEGGDELVTKEWHDTTKSQEK